MIKKYEVESIIKDALEELDGKVSEPKGEDGVISIFEASVEKDKNGDLIFLFRENSHEKIDKYIIRITYE